MKMRMSKLSNQQWNSSHKQSDSKLNFYFKKVNGISLLQNVDNSSHHQIILKEIESDDKIVSIGIKNKSMNPCFWDVKWKCTCCNF